MGRRAGRHEEVGWGFQGMGSSRTVTGLVPWAARAILLCCYCRTIPRLQVAHMPSAYCEPVENRSQASAVLSGARSKYRSSPLTSEVRVCLVAGSGRAAAVGR